jgi:hypothetical protein
MCLFLLWPTKVQTKLSLGIDLINWRCFAPLFLHFSLDAGMGMFIRLPFNNGLLETTLILRF